VGSNPAAPIEEKPAICRFFCFSAAPIFQTLADPTRLSIVEAMRGGECAVGDLVDRVDIKQSGVSRHLRILHEAGLVQVRPDGQRRLYPLRAQPFAEGIESWWGPEGFTVTVQAMDVRPGGVLLYTMTATAAPQIAFMKQHGMPLSTPASAIPCIWLGTKLGSRG